MKRLAVPMAMGAMMGVMGLWMLHGALTGQGAAFGLGFVLAHIAVVAVPAALLALGVGRHSAWLRRLSRHRPSRVHLAVMLAAALCVAAVIHLVHGGPTWT